MTIEIKGRITSHSAIVMASRTCARRIKQKKPDKLFSHVFCQIHEGNKKNVNMIQRIIVLRLFQSARNSSDTATKPSFSKI